jgi:phospholipid/cholesterol/gamma-HCH transport system substrate-binding protein
MEYRSSEIRAGLFIFTGFIVLLVMVFFLGNFKDSFKPKKGLRIVFNFTGGLGVGAPVRYAGLDIGRVIGIELEKSRGEKLRDRIAVIAQINPSIRIKKTAQAQIKTSGLMGGLYIEIRPGSSEAEELDDDESLVGQDTFEFAQLGDIMGEFLGQVQRFTDLSSELIVDSRATLGAVQKSLDRVDRLVANNEVRVQTLLTNMNQVSVQLAALLAPGGEIPQSVKHLVSITEKTDRLVSEKEQSIAATIDHAQKVTRELELLLADNRPALTSVLHNVDAQSQKIGSKLDSATDTLDQAFQQTNGILVENRRNLQELIKNLKDTTQALKDFSQDVKLNPWKLVRKGDEKEPAETNRERPPAQPDNSIRMKRLDKTAVTKE